MLVPLEGSTGAQECPVPSLRAHLLLFLIYPGISKFWFINFRGPGTLLTEGCPPGVPTGINAKGHFSWGARLCSLDYCADRPHGRFSKLCVLFRCFFQTLCLWIVAHVRFLRQMLGLLWFDWYIYIYIYIHTHTHTHTCIHICMCIYIYIHTHICVCIYIYIYIYIHMYIYIYIERERDRERERSHTWFYAFGYGSWYPRFEIVWIEMIHRMV